MPQFLDQVMNCEDCETSLAELFCRDCQNANDGQGLYLCQPCSDAIHAGAARRRHTVDGKVQRIFLFITVTIGKSELEGRSVIYGSASAKVSLTAFPETSPFFMKTKDSLIDY